LTTAVPTPRIVGWTKVAAESKRSAGVTRAMSVSWLAPALSSASAPIAADDLILSAATRRAGAAPIQL
jgi:hypothetical protein